MIAHVAAVAGLSMFIASIFVPRDQISASIRDNGKLVILSLFGVCILWWFVFGLEEEEQKDQFVHRRRGPKDMDS